MTGSTVSIDTEAVAATMRRIAQGRSAVPASGEIARAVGTSANIAADFHAALEQASISLADLVAKVIEETKVTEDAIRATVADLVESDAENAEQATQILQMLESTVNPEDNADAIARDKGISVANARQAW